MRDYQLEIMDQFESQLNKLSQEMKELIDQLTDDDEYLNAVNSLFRHFHSLKATVSYLDFEDILTVVKKTEEVLSILRHYSKAPSNRSLFAWLDGVSAQIKIWVSEFETNDGVLSETSPALLDALSFSYDQGDPRLLLKKLSILIVIKSDKLRGVLKENFTKLFKEVLVSKDAKEGFKKYLHNQPSIVISDFNLQENANGFAMVKKIMQADNKLPIIMLFDTYNRSLLMKLNIYGISTMTKPLKLGHLYSQILEKTQIMYGSKRIKITNEAFQEIVEALKPLPDSIMKVQQLCDNPDTSVRDVVAAVKRDTIFSGLILKEANMPIYGNQGMDSIERAVGFFGKRAVKALSLAGLANQLGNINLQCYGLSAENFFEVSQMRMRLMISWYAKVSISDLNILATTAVLGNIGQIIIAKEIENLGRSEEFLAIVEEQGCKVAEEHILNITAAEITADILSYWNLDRTLVDSIRYSDNVEQAPDEVIPYSLANHIVFELIPPRFKDVPIDLSENISELMIKHELDKKPLFKAMERMVATLKS